jgi:uncharacterized membrane protein
MAAPMNIETIVAWAFFSLSLMLLVGYEWRIHHIGQKQPERLARYANAKLRMHWVASMGDKPGFEIVAVQALRNSLMAASISASTAALAVMGALSMLGASLFSNLTRWSGENALPTVLQAMLVGLLFASYVCSAMSTRHYSHASFIMSMPVGQPERQAMNPGGQPRAPRRADVQLGPAPVPDGAAGGRRHRAPTGHAAGHRAAAGRADPVRPAGQRCRGRLISLR